MPLIIDANAVNPPAPETITSSDGILTATVDPDHGGVLLEADFTAGAVTNVDDFTEDIAGWSQYSNGAAIVPTLALDAGRLKITINSVSTSGGAVWALPVPLPAGPVRVAFEWAGLLKADRLRVALDNAAGAALAVFDFPARNGVGSSAPWIGDAVVAEPVTRVRIYANGNVLGQTIYLENVSAATRMPHHARFLRGDGTAVAGGDPQRTPGGQGPAYDQEVPFGTATAWHVVGYDAADRQITTSQAVALILPAITNRSKTSDGRHFQGWLKSITDPGLSMPVKIHDPVPEFGMTGQFNSQRVPGSAYPGGSFDVMTVDAFTIVVHTDSKAERDAFIELVRDGGPLFLQVNAAAQIDDCYVQPLGFRDTYLVGSWDPRHHLALTVQPVRRPPTVDAPLIIPGRSYDDAAAIAPTHDQASIVWTHYEDTYR